jgi:hypothetical protein
VVNLQVIQDATEEYDGSTWSPSGSLNTARRYLGGCGTQTAALAFGGYTTATTGATEEYNGATWSPSNPMVTVRLDFAGCGTQTAALAFGSPTHTEEYDGTSWTSVNSMNTARYGLAGCGIQTSALAFGGASPATGATELYDGTSWTSNPTGLKYSKILFSRCWHSNSSFSFWW